MSQKQAMRVGDWIEKKVIRCVNRTGTTLTVGEVVALDLTGSDGDVDTFAEWEARTAAGPNPTTNPLANCIVPATAHLTGWIFGVVQDASVADNGVFNLLLSGYTLISVTSGAVVNGDKLAGANGVKTAAKAGDGAAQIALAVESNGSSAKLIRCLFNVHTSPAGAAST